MTLPTFLNFEMDKRGPFPGVTSSPALGLGHRHEAPRTGAAHLLLVKDEALHQNLCVWGPQAAPNSVRFGAALRSSPEALLA